MDLQIPPEQPAEVACDRAQRGVVEPGGTLREVLDQQVAHGPALDAVGVDDLLDAVAAVHAQHPEPLGRARWERASLPQQRVEQRTPGAAPEMVLLQRFGQLDAVAHGDIGDEPALADHDPGELVQRVRSLTTGTFGHLTCGGPTSLAEDDQRSRFDDRKTKSAVNGHPAASGTKTN
ncbi:hypothetical protein [Phytohabitans suffuscus]|uniref:hypothetical protein n=1 Tax=Phytohabitans suffuscus TaxID=624315 RepID=UPI0018D841ED